MTLSVSSVALTPEEDRRQQFYVQLLQGNRDVNGLLDLLSVVVDRQDWKRLSDAKGRELSFRSYVELPFQQGGIGWSIPNLRVILNLRHDDERAERAPSCGETVERLQAMRQRIEALLLERPGRIGKEGRPRKDDQENSDNIRVSHFGNDPDYLTARIARDAPEVFERLKAGEFKSVHAAAKAAGIKKDPTPFDQLCRAWSKASEDERQRFIHWASPAGD